MSGVDLIREERRRQRSRAGRGESYSLGHDDAHTGGQLARAAAFYALPAEWRIGLGRGIWPAGGWRFKPDSADRIRELVKAGALIAAEIDRLERASQATPERSETVEPREGAVMVYHWDGRYLGCMGIERWERLLREDAP